jgi:BlaI family transcriptional regulator, penicillinase repressor
MAKKSVPRPTDAELAILRVLWDLGPSTVRQVHERLGSGRGLQYTTTLKLLQIMTEKGLTDRVIEGRSHVYTTRQEKEETQRRLVDDLLDRAFGGSAAALVMQALASKPATAGELAEISRMIDASKKSGPKSRAKKEKNRG